MAGMTDSPACRPGCGACCIAPSITSPLPEMPRGKPAGLACIQLDDQMRCRVFGRPERPTFCTGLKPSSEMCGTDRHHALRWLTALERATRPPRTPCTAPLPPPA
jgi:Fe-S-cluster containining protein